jgi:hypothetical protein
VLIALSTASFHPPFSMTSTSSSQPPELRYIKPIPVLRCHNVEDSLLWWTRSVPPASPPILLPARTDGGSLARTRLGFKIGGKHDGFLSVAAGDKAIVNLYMREPSAESFPVGLGEIIILLDVRPVTIGCLLMQLLTSLHDRLVR